MTQDPERWEYVGQCVECGAGLCEMGGRIKPNCPVEEGHLCHLEVEEDEFGVMKKEDKDEHDR